MFLRFIGIASILLAVLIYGGEKYYLILGTFFAIIIMFFSYGKSPEGMLVGIFLLLIFTGLKN